MADYIAIKLTPKASSERVGEVRRLPGGEEELALYVTAPPEDNKANKAMLKLLAKHLGVAVSRLSIVQGATRRHKRVRLD